MTKYKVKLKNYEVEELVLSKDNVMDVVSYLYDMKVPQDSIVSIDEVNDKVYKGIVEEEVKELNRYVDESKSRDGGGYSQPHIKGTVDGVKFEVIDMGVGDFGERAELVLGDHRAGYDFVLGNEVDFSEIPRELDGLVEKLNEKYKTVFMTNQGTREYKV